MDILPVKWSDKIPAQLREDIMRQFIIRMFEVFDLHDQGPSFVKIRFAYNMSQQGPHFGYIISRFFKEFIKDLVLRHEDLQEGIECHNYYFNTVSKMNNPGWLRNYGGIKSRIRRAEN